MTARARIGEIEARHAERDELREHGGLVNVVVAEMHDDIRFLLDALRSARGEAEDKTDALQGILNWARAYPVTVFIEPDFKKAREVLGAAGISMDALHGSWARHLLGGIGGIAERALSLPPDTKDAQS